MLRTQYVVTVDVTEDEQNERASIESRLYSLRDEYDVRLGGRVKVYVAERTPTHGVGREDD